MLSGGNLECLAFSPGQVVRIEQKAHFVQFLPLFFFFRAVFVVILTMMFGTLCFLPWSGQGPCKMYYRFRRLVLSPAPLPLTGWRRFLFPPSGGGRGGEADGSAGTTNSGTSQGAAGRPQTPDPGGGRGQGTSKAGPRPTATTPGRTAPRREARTEPAPNKKNPKTKLNKTLTFVKSRSD